MAWMMILVGAQGVLAIVQTVRGLRLRRANDRLSDLLTAATDAVNDAAGQIEIQTRDLAYRTARAEYWYRENRAARAALRAIADMETPSANATVRRMSKRALETLKP